MKQSNNLQIIPNTPKRLEVNIPSKYTLLITTVKMTSLSYQCFCFFNTEVEIPDYWLALSASDLFVPVSPSEVAEMLLLFFP